MATSASLNTPTPIAASPATAFRGLAARIGRWYRASRDRRELASLNDATLSDIGLSRGDVEREYLKPFWRSVDRGTLEAVRRNHGRPRA